VLPKKLKRLNYTEYKLVEPVEPVPALRLDRILPGCCCPPCCSIPMAKRKAAAAADAGAAVQQPGKHQKVDAAPDVAAAKQKRSFRNKEKVLVLGTRGITYRYTCMHH
jgi:hypothetical protein